MLVLTRFAADQTSSTIRSTYSWKAP